MLTLIRYGNSRRLGTIQRQFFSNKRFLEINMEDKYIKFYKTFDKRFKNNKNLILCSKSLSDCGVGKGFYLHDLFP